jgi:aryl-alcohol dehydrogenase-like predicted oxidoreductase
MQFSRLMLGTVQFGLEYGIANESGKPSFDRVCEIVKTAFEGGVTALDTAAAYGTSEEVLGAALERLGLREAMTVVSKVPPIPDGADAEAERFIERSLRESLRRLRLGRLAVCLLHREEDLRHLPLLEKMVGRGLTGGAGSRWTATVFWQRRRPCATFSFPATCWTAASMPSGPWRCRRRFTCSPGVSICRGCC